MDKKKILWGILFVFIAAFSIWAVTAQNKNFSVEMMNAFVKDANKLWLFAAALCSFGFIWFEGCALARTCKGLGYRKSIREGTIYGGADVYFSAITPSATGGQPASAYFMIKDGMPASAVTAVLLINLVMYTLALLFWGVLCIIFRFDILREFSLISKLFILIGCMVLTGLVIVFYMLLRKEGILHKICEALLCFLERIHLVKRAKKRREWLERTTKEYKRCAKIVTGKGNMLLEIFFWNAMQRLSQLAVSFMIFMATGKSVQQALNMGVTQCFVAMGSNCVPIPGAMGVADYIMLDGLKNMMTNEAAVSMEILCRGVTFYGSVVIGLVIVVIGYLQRKMRKKNAGIL